MELEKYKDAFTINIANVQYALSFNKDIRDIYLINLKIKQNPEIKCNIKDKKSFFIAQISEEMGI